MKKIKASDRFDEVELYPPRVDRFFPEQPPLSEDAPHDRVYYACPDCEFRVKIRNHDFEGVVNSFISNLSKTDQEKFNASAKEFGLINEKFLDFYCPGCGSPVRVYFKAGAGGRHGDFFCTVTWVLEENHAPSK